MIDKLSVQQRAVAVTLGGLVSLYAVRKYLNRPRKVGTVSSLYVHPLKSCRGNEVNRAYAGELGLVSPNGLGDRTWSIKYAHNDVKVSARECHQLFKIEVSRNGDVAEFDYPGVGKLALPVPTDGPNSSEATKVHIFGEDVEAVDCGEDAATWATKIVGKPCRIVTRPRNRHLRKVEAFRRNWRLENLPVDADLAAFQDGYPFLTLGEDSLNNINANVADKDYTIRTFRPNIVIKAANGEPWAEDSWKGILKIGEAEFAMASPCPRCVMTTVDPDTCKRDATGEPLKSLKKFRQAAGRDREHLDVYKTTPMVGMNTVLIKAGNIAVGDEIILTPS